MSIKTDIAWIKHELDKVDDPDLISAFKSLLSYRERQSKLNAFREDRIEYAKRSEEDFEAGRTYTPDEALEELTKRLKK
ncbi:MAG: hypothetical protein EP314_04120 [Bacteroidetes bacterium]|nr:MAG: hypothetical protein EP314_04120 [Bacteroidota bacterium]